MLSVAPAFKTEERKKKITKNFALESRMGLVYNGMHLKVLGEKTTVHDTN